jgi:DNA-directed RNA polymerase alpha subunit
VTDESEALSLFLWALQHGDTACMEEIQAAVPSAQHWAMPIEDLDLMVTGYNRLKEAGANMVAEVIDMSAAQVRKLRHARQPMTEAAYNNIVERLTELGLRLKDE